MAADAFVYVRINSELKKEVDVILKKLGVTPSALITMLYHKIVLTGGLPFEIRLPIREPIATGNLSEEQVNQLIMEGYNSSSNGDVSDLDEIKKVLKERFDIEIGKKV